MKTLDKRTLWLKLAANSHGTATINREGTGDLCVTGIPHGISDFEVILHVNRYTHLLREVSEIAYGEIATPQATTRYPMHNARFQEKDP